MKVGRSPQDHSNETKISQGLIRESLQTQRFYTARVMCCLGAAVDRVGRAKARTRGAAKVGGCKTRSAMPLWPHVGRLCPVFRRPLLGKLGQKPLLAGHPLDGQGIDGDHIQSREEVLWTDRIRLAVFFQQPFAEPLFGRSIFRDTNPAEQDNAPVRQTRIALKAAIVEDVVRFVELKTDPRLALNVSSQMTARTGSVHEDLVVRPDIQQGHAIGIPILAHGRESPDKSATKRAQHLLVRHRHVGASQTWGTHCHAPWSDRRFRVVVDTHWLEIASWLKHNARMVLSKGPLDADRPYHSAMPAPDRLISMRGEWSEGAATELGEPLCVAADPHRRCAVVSSNLPANSIGHSVTKLAARD